MLNLFQYHTLNLSDFIICKRCFIEFSIKKDAVSIPNALICHGLVKAKNTCLFIKRFLPTQQFYFTKTPRNCIKGTVCKAFSLIVFFLKRYVLSNSWLPLKKVTLNSLLSATTFSCKYSILA